MDIKIIAAMSAIVVVILSLVVSANWSRLPQSINGFFFGQRRFSWVDSALLLWAASLSLNGLFYHTWLGYTVGIWSFVIQIIWCGGYIYLATKRDRLVEVYSRGSLPTNFLRVYGATSAYMAAILSIYGFVALVGWEMAIATSFAKSAFAFTEVGALVFLFVIVFSAAIYTIRGGVRANLNANRFHMVLKIVAFAICCYAIWKISTAHDASSITHTDRLKLNVGQALVGLGGPLILIANALFSFFWQAANTQTWQTLTASTKSNRPNWVLWGGAVGILIGPGLLGTVLGMSMAHVQGLESDSEVIVNLFSELVSSPILAGLFIAALVAAMMSTIDGMLLGVSLDYLTGMSKDKETVSDVYLGNVAGGETDWIYSSESGRQVENESKVLSKAQIGILLATVVSTGVYFLVQTPFISLFEVVYIAVLGHMALVPASLNLLKSRDDQLAATRNSVLSMSLGTITAVMCCVFHFQGVSTLFGWQLPWLFAGVPFTLAAATLGLFLSKR